MITNKPTYFIDTGTIVNAGKKKMIYTAYLYIISVYIICIYVYYTGARTPLPHIPFCLIETKLAQGRTRESMGERMQLLNISHISATPRENPPLGGAGLSTARFSTKNLNLSELKTF